MLTVFVGFDDPNSSVRASKVCDLMTARYWPEMEFELHLCDFTQLKDASYRQQAISNAAAAHVVVMATSLAESLDSPTRDWMDGMCVLRHEREGALVALVDPTATERLQETTELHLRQLAHRAGLDYLTHEPDCRSLRIPDEANWVDARVKLSSLLESILEQPSRPMDDSR